MFEIFKGGNVIKSGAFTLGSFTKLCPKMNIVSTILQLHTEVGWLSKGKFESLYITSMKNWNYLFPKRERGIGI
jgi:hypothetical protein